MPDPNSTELAPRREVILTFAEAALAQVRYEALIAKYKAKRTTPPTPHEYWVFEALWACAYGADVIRIVDQPHLEEPKTSH